MAVAPPLYDADAKMYQTNHDTKKRPCTVALSVLFCSLAPRGRHGTPAEMRGQPAEPERPQKTFRFTFTSGQDLLAMSLRDQLRPE